MPTLPAHSEAPHHVHHTCKHHTHMPRTTPSTHTLHVPHKLHTHSPRAHTCLCTPLVDTHLHWSLSIPYHTPYPAPHTAGALFLNHKRGCFLFKLLSFKWLSRTFIPTFQPLPKLLRPTVVYSLKTLFRYLHPPAPSASLDHWPIPLPQLLLPRACPSSILFREHTCFIVRVRIAFPPLTPVQSPPLL